MTYIYLLLTLEIQINAVNYILLYCQVIVGKTPVTGIRLYLEGVKCDR